EPSLHLPMPEDVKIDSQNFHSVLRWSPVPVEGGLVLYTVHYKTGAFPQWQEMNCTRIPWTRCVFPPLIQKRRWTVSLRVRAELGTGTSAWAHTGPFVAEHHTILGPPSVTSVRGSSNSLVLSVTPPFTPEPGEILQYRVLYWENTTRSTEKLELRGRETLLQMRDLKESTLYCFSVRVELERDDKKLLVGQPSAPECHSTA
ncbi:INAR1 protein, partial [Campylorhamphus procurvoides]|nr:INAR1 protein [Campylorhamphus procurvoides]